MLWSADSIEIATDDAGDKSRCLREDTTGRWASIISEARDWLDVNPACRRPLPRLARRLGVSYANLHREFQNATGQSVTPYRVARRVEEAKARLIHCDVFNDSDGARLPRPLFPPSSRKPPDWVPIPLIPIAEMNETFHRDNEEN